MSEFLNFLILVVFCFLVFVLVLGFNKQMIEKNSKREEKRRARDAKKDSH